MRIWYQSSMSLEANPEWSDYSEALARNLRKAARPDTQLVVHGVEIFSPLVEKYSYVEMLNNRQIVDNAIRAQHEGYDAFAVGCMIDPAHDATYEVVDIPVVFIGEISMHIATILATKFAFLSYNKKALLRQTELAKRYGLHDRLISAGSFHLDLVDLQKGFKDPEFVLKPARGVARAAAEAGAGALVPTCNCFNMILRSNNITEIEGLPVVEGGTVLVKMAELMVDLKKLGISRSNHGLYTRMAAEELASARKQYGVEKATAEKHAVPR